jgi:molybdopterin-guanine dinucleotide biosynthesis protein A
MATASAASGPPVVGVLLAGGQARRMGGGDKCLRRLGGQPILARVIARAAPQVRALVLNANGDPQRFEAFGLPVAADLIAGFTGPLAGVLTGMAWTRANRPDCPWIATIATDTPFFPAELVARLLAKVELEKAELACAASGGRAHPVFGLWPVRLAGALQAAIAGEAIRKVDAWTARYRLIEVDFPSTPVDPFFNTNRPEDLAEAERLLGELDPRSS